MSEQFKETEIGPVPVDWEAVLLLAPVEEEHAKADAELDAVLVKLGFGG